MPWNNSDVCKVQQPMTQERKVFRYRSQMLPLRIRPSSILNELSNIQKRNRNLPDPDKERITRLQAIRKRLKLNPDPELFFSNAVKSTSNQTTSKSPTGSDQESQSGSSKDTSETQFFFSPTVPTYGLGYYTRGKGKNIRNRPPLR